MQAGDAAYVTFDPLHRELTCLDYERPDAASLPTGWRHATKELADASPRYLECRIASAAAPPEWVIYLPYAH